MEFCARFDEMMKTHYTNKTLNSSQESGIEEADSSSNCDTSKGADSNGNLSNLQDTQEPDLTSNRQEEQVLLVASERDKGIPQYVHLNL